MKNTIKGNFVGFTNGDPTITNSKDTIKEMTNNKQLSLIDALCILRTGYKTQQESELVDHAYLVIKQHSERLHLEYQRECIDEKLFKIKEDDKQQ